MNPGDSEFRVQQLQLDEFATQRREHNRQFFELLGELDSGHRSRQEQVSGLLRNVRLAFDAAQARRHDEWRAAQNDLRQYAIRVQESCATQSEGARDVAARGGLVRFEQRAEYLGSLFNATRRELDDWAAMVEPSGAAWTAFIMKLRSVLDGKADISLAPSSSAPNPTGSLYHGFLDPHSRTLPSSLSGASPPGLSRHSQDPDAVQRPRGPSPQPFISAADIEAIDSVVIADPGKTEAYRDAFSQLQLIRSRIWEHMCATHSGALEAWTADFRNLETELSAVFMYHPCMDGESDDPVILTATMLVAFRAAESRREMELQRSWRYIIRRLTGLVQSWALTAGLQRIPGIPGSTRPSSVGQTLSIPMVGSTYPMQCKDQLFHENLGMIPCFGPGNLARAPNIAGPLPVTSSGQRQLEAFRRQQDIHAQQFSEKQSAYRSHGQLTETRFSSQFATALYHWETRAAQAELRRSSEFAHALERMRKLLEDKVARNCHEVAMSLEKVFEESQELRERTFLDELERLHEQLLQFCREFRDSLAAMAQPSGSFADAADLVPMPQMGEN